MRLAGAKRQTIFLTGINAVVRALGLAMRVWMSRVLGAEVMGVMELAQSVHMVAISPLTSGLPVAISRLTARSDKYSREHALEAGLWLARKASLLLVPALWLLSPVIARGMGDVRVLPSLWFTAPCVLILGYSASYNGYCYGLERSDLPALSELIRTKLEIPYLDISFEQVLPIAGVCMAIAVLTGIVAAVCSAYRISKDEAYRLIRESE